MLWVAMIAATPLVASLLAGPFHYVAPDWKPLRIRTLEGSVDEKGQGYHWDFMSPPWKKHTISFGEGSAAA
jgi:hypothetical protein